MCIPALHVVAKLGNSVYIVQPPWMLRNDVFGAPIAVGFYDNESDKVQHLKCQRVAQLCSGYSEIRFITVQFFVNWPSTHDVYGNVDILEYSARDE